jgi:hypothetical protein
MLKYMYRNRPIQTDVLTNLNAAHTKEFVNLNAALDAYRRGDVKVVEVTAWFAGRIIMGPIYCCELKNDDSVDKVPEWQEKYGPSHVWAEEVCLYGCPSTQYLTHY